MLMEGELCCVADVNRGGGGIFWAKPLMKFGVVCLVACLRPFLAFVRGVFRTSLLRCDEAPRVPVVVVVVVVWTIGIVWTVVVVG